jgi:hypothetical protein
MTPADRRSGDTPTFRDVITNGLPATITTHVLFSNTQITNLAMSFVCFLDSIIVLPTPANPLHAPIPYQDSPDFTAVFCRDQTPRRHYGRLTWRDGDLIDNDEQ